MHDLEMPLNSRLSYDDKTPFQILREHHLSDTKIHFDPFMNSVRMTFEHYKWNFFTKIVSQQTCVLFDTIFVKKFQMKDTCVTFGSREYRGKVKS